MVPAVLPLSIYLHAQPQASSFLANIEHATGRVLGTYLLEPIRDPAPGKVVGREFDDHFVPRKDSDVVHPHLAGDVREHAMTVLEFDAKHRVGQRFYDRPFHLYGIFALAQRPTLLLSGAESQMSSISTLAY